MAWKLRAVQGSAASAQAVSVAPVPTHVPESKLPEGVRRFVAEEIDSAESLEILLHLYRNPDQGHMAEQVSAAGDLRFGEGLVHGNPV